MGMQGQGAPGAGGPIQGPTPYTARKPGAAPTTPADTNLPGDSVAAPGLGPDDPSNPKSPNYKPPAPPTTPTTPTTPPAGPDIPGLLAQPGPYETWASEHAGDLGAPSNAETLYGTNGQGLLNDPSDAEAFYAAHGQDWANPSNSETLYSQGIGQLNPYYDYASQVGTKAINDAAAAHGGFSSTAMNQLGLLNANLRGQQAQQMATLAKQADDARNARYGLGETEAGAADKGKLDRYGLAGTEANAADQAKLNRYGAQASIYSTWQDKEATRLAGALSGQMGLSSAQADQVDQFYKNILTSGQYDAESINAALQAAGVDPNSAFGKDLIGVGQMIIKAYATGK